MDVMLELVAQSMSIHARREYLYGVGPRRSKACGVDRHQGPYPLPHFNTSLRAPLQCILWISLLISSQLLPHIPLHARCHRGNVYSGGLSPH